MNNFSLIDYTGGSPVETECDQTNVTIEPGTSSSAETTYLSIVLSSVPITNEKVSHVSQDMYFKNNMVSFTTIDNTPVILKLYDVRGRFITTLADKVFNPGQHSVGIDANNLAGGLYLCRMETKGMQKNISITLSK